MAAATEQLVAEAMKYGHKITQGSDGLECSECHSRDGNLFQACVKNMPHIDKTYALYNQAVATVMGYLKNLLKTNTDFTGKVELNFKDGKLMDINETRRTKVAS